MEEGKKSHRRGKSSSKSKGGGSGDNNDGSENEEGTNHHDDDGEDQDDGGDTDTGGDKVSSSFPPPKSKSSRQKSSGASSSKSSSSKVSSSKSSASRRPRRTSGDHGSGADVSEEGGGGSGTLGPSTSSRLRKSGSSDKISMEKERTMRSGRRTSTGTHDEKTSDSTSKTSTATKEKGETTSLSSLNKHSRRRSTGDDKSVAESVSSRGSASVPGGDKTRRPGTKRSGRRRHEGEGDDKDTKEKGDKPMSSSSHGKDSPKKTSSSSAAAAADSSPSAEDAATIYASKRRGSGRSLETAASESKPTSATGGSDKDKDKGKDKMNRRTSHRSTEQDGDPGSKAPSKPKRGDSEKDKKKKDPFSSDIAGGGAGGGDAFAAGFGGGGAAAESTPGFPSFGSSNDNAGFSSGFGAFGATDGGGGSADGGMSTAFGGSNDHDGGFGGFGDTSGFPTNTTTTTKTHAASSSASGAFGAFSATPAATTPAAAAAPSFENAFATSGFNATEDAFSTFDSTGAGGFGADSNAFFSQAAPSFDTPQVTNWDKSVLTDIPQRPESKLQLFSQPSLSATFLGKPTTNPANGNIIFCAEAKDGVVYLHEVDPYHDNMQVASTPVLSGDLQRKLAAKYSVSACFLESVITLTAGLHRAHGQARLRVAAILDLRVVESHQVMRVVAVWQWGYAAPYAIALQYALTPPSGGDFTYDSFTLQVADGLMFIAGSSPKGPCIFMCKPAVRETWSANFLPGIARITCMAVTPSVHRDHPYLAVSFNDRTVSIWTYKTALSQTAAKGNEPSKRWLFPLCRVDGHDMMLEAEASSLRMHIAGSTADEKKGDEDEEKEGGDEETTEKAADASPAATLPEEKDLQDPGCCTDLAWYPPQHSMGNIPMLAATYQNGFAVFHVGLPVTPDKSSGGFSPLPDPTQSTTISQTPALLPIAVKRWKGDHDQAFATWLNVGPYDGPCLGVLLHQTENTGGAAMVVIGTFRWPLYRRGPPPKSKPVPFEILGVTSFGLNAAPYPMGIIHVSGRGSVELFSNETFLSVALRRKPMVNDAGMLSLRHPISTIPPGLSSTGEYLLTDGNDDKEGVLHIFGLFQCERQKSAFNPSLQDWSRPRRRYWLCRTLVGDTKASAIVEETKEEKGFGEDEAVKGGASSDTICELFDESLDNMLPFRMVRCKGASVCAVVYRPCLGVKSETTSAGGGLSMDGTCIALVDYSGANPVIKVVEGRDIAFAPLEGELTKPCGWILSRDGAKLTLFSWDSGSKEFEMGSSFRPVVGVDTDVNYIESRRIFAFSGAAKIILMVVGTRLRDNKTCLISGDLCDLADSTDDKWSTLLPNIVAGRSLWLGEGEEVYSMVGLEGDDSGYRNFALSTSYRAVIVSSALTISAETPTSNPASALAPLGSFAVAFCSGDKLRYLCCLGGRFVQGAIATLPLPYHGHATTMLTAIRPDRILLARIHEGVRLVDYAQNPNIFLLPTSQTRPALMLEPMVANAICVGGKQNVSTIILRTVIEKFGRKMQSFTHGDDEGIGNLGAGLTSQTFEMLNAYGLHQAASWLLTGSVPFDRTANSRILPAWLPIAAKKNGCLNSDALLHVVANGDPYLSEYIKAPGVNMPSSLPRQSDPMAYIAREMGKDALRRGQPVEALKLLDLAGSTTTDSLLLQIALVMKKGPGVDVNSILNQLSGLNNTSAFSRATSAAKAPASLAALALGLRQGGLTEEQTNRFMKPLAPSLQRATRAQRTRISLLTEEDLKNAGEVVNDPQDPFFVSPCNESKHVWNEGPRRQKDHLMMLNSIEEWLGRKRPVIFGKEAASAAADRGEKTLADILNQGDDDSFGGKSDIESAKEDDWVDGVGEGRSDEANLSAYFRFSEGEDEDSPWRNEGVADLSPYQNKATVVGENESVSLQPTTSSVDEGEPGKVKTLYDVVFDKSGDGIASGLAIKASRGSSVDVGVLHRADKNTRQKCSIEFWYYLPSAENVPSDMVLVRRSMGDSGDDLTKVCLASEKACAIWEIRLKPSGELEFSSCGGGSFLSSQNYTPPDPAATDAADSDEEKERADLAKFGKWNHVCVVLCSRDNDDITKCSVALYMKGEEVASEDEVSMAPPGFDEHQVDDTMQKSYVVFGLNHGAGYRMTELRVWACERSSDDTQTFLYEYLTAAEGKKKFKVKISNKKGGANKFGKGGVGVFGAAKGGTGMLGAPKGGGIGGPAGPRGMLAPKAGGGMFAGPKAGGLVGPPAATDKPAGLLSLAPPPKEEPKFSLAPLPETKGEPSMVGIAQPEVPASQIDSAFSADAAFGAFGFGDQPMDVTPSPMDQPTDDQLSMPMEDEIPMEEGEEEVPTTLWDTAVPLSQQVRSSAAAALIRGPPATRHFGGNRGGLPDFSGMERSGVGGIAICGSEKTIVWRDNEDPPALTYPIGASGAVVSDLMDDEGSEFLCCFLAKEKRMVVFELQSRTVVVELQMTTKLNFWRFLPPEAAENTLCFMLVTPVGGFHWMPLEESPRPHQVWKRGSDLQGKKVVNYEEGGSNGHDGPDILSRVGLVMVTKATGGGTLEAWIVPIDGDSKASQVSEDVMGACFCQPPFVEDGPFLPLLVTVHHVEGSIYVNVLSVTEPKKGSVALGEIEVTRVIEDAGVEDVDFEPPPLAMGSFPEAICCSVGNIVVVIIRRKGLIAAFEIEEEDLSLIALEGVGHYVIDAVMRYSVEVGGAEIVMLLSDQDNLKDGRMVSFCFRSAT